MNTARRGRYFEELAQSYLIDRGWRVLDRNVRFLRKEIDLVVARNEVVAFVEVKGRTGTAHGHPLEAITWRKRRAISLAARMWMAQSDFRAEVYRFDAIAIRLVPGRDPELEHIEGAWWD